jgi:hypothetical protein
MRQFKKIFVAAALGLFFVQGPADAGYFTSVGTYKVTFGDTVEQVVCDMGAREANDIQLVSSPGRRYLQGQTLQQILDAGHILWANDEYVRIR